MLDFQLGANLLSLSFVTGIGTRYPRHPHHQLSEWDGVPEPIPGVPVFGPSNEFPNHWLYSPPIEKAYPTFYGTEKVPPYRGYPRGRHYLDQYGIVNCGEFGVPDMTVLSGVLAYLSHNTA